MRTGFGRRALPALAACQLNRSRANGRSRAGWEPESIHEVIASATAGAIMNPCPHQPVAKTTFSAPGTLSMIGTPSYVVASRREKTQAVPGFSGSSGGGI